MAKKKLKTSKSTKMKSRRLPVPKPKTGTSGTKVKGQVSINYVQTAVPDKHAKDVCDVLAQLILSDAHRGYVGVTHKDENDGF